MNKAFFTVDIVVVVDLVAGDGGGDSSGRDDTDVRGDNTSA